VDYIKCFSTGEILHPMLIDIGALIMADNTVYKYSILEWVPNWNKIKKYGRFYIPWIYGTIFYPLNMFVNGVDRTISRRRCYNVDNTNIQLEEDLKPGSV